MGKTKSNIIIKNIEFYDKLIGLNLSIERKGKTMPYTSSAGLAAWPQPVEGPPLF